MIGQYGSRNQFYLGGFLRILKIFGRCLHLQFLTKFPGDIKKIVYLIFNPEVSLSLNFKFVRLD
jgi:hypothetical protein